MKNKQLHQITDLYITLQQYLTTVLEKRNLHKANSDPLMDKGIDVKVKMVHGECVGLDIAGPSPFDTKTLEKSVYVCGCIMVCSLKASCRPYLSHDTSVS